MDFYYSHEHAANEMGEYHSKENDPGTPPPNNYVSVHFNIRSDENFETNLFPIEIDDHNENAPYYALDFISTLDNLMTIYSNDDRKCAFYSTAFGGYNENIELSGIVTNNAVENELSVLEDVCAVIGVHLPDNKIKNKSTDMRWFATFIVDEKIANNLAAPYVIFFRWFQ